MRDPRGGRSRIAADHQFAGRGRVDADAALAAIDRAGGRVRGGNRLAAGRFQRGAERMHAGVDADEGVVRRQNRNPIATSEMHRACISRGSVVERVLSSDREAMRDTCGGRRRITADEQLIGGGRVDRDARLTAFDGTGRGIGGSERLAAGRFQGGAERVHAVIARDKAIVGRQDRGGVTTGEMHRARISARRVVEGILGGHREVMGRAGGGRRGIAADQEFVGGRRADRDAAFAAFDGAGDGIGGVD